MRKNKVFRVVAFAKKKNLAGQEKKTHKKIIIMSKERHGKSHPRWRQVREWLAYGFGCRSRCVDTLTTTTTTPVIITQCSRLCTLPTDIVSICFTYLGARDHQRMVRSCRTLQRIGSKASSGTHLKLLVSYDTDGSFEKDLWPSELHTLSSPQSVTLRCLGHVRVSLARLFLWFHRVEHLILQVERFENTSPREDCKDALTWKSLTSRVTRLSLYLPPSLFLHFPIWPSNLVHLSVTMNVTQLVPLPPSLCSLCVKMDHTPPLADGDKSWLDWWNNLAHLPALSKLDLTWQSRQCQWGYPEWTTLATFPALTDLTLRHYVDPSLNIENARIVTEHQRADTSCTAVPICKRVTQLRLENALDSSSIFFGEVEPWRVCGTLFPMVEDVTFVWHTVTSSICSVRRQCIKRLALVWSASLQRLSTTEPIRLSSPNRIHTLSLINMGPRHVQRVLRESSGVRQLTHLTYIDSPRPDSVASRLLTYIGFLRPDKKLSSPLIDRSVASRLVSFTWKAHFGHTLEIFFSVAPHLVSLQHLHLCETSNRCDISTFRPCNHSSCSRTTTTITTLPTSTRPPYHAVRLVTLHLENLYIRSAWFWYLMYWCHATIKSVVTVSLPVDRYEWRYLWFDNRLSFPQMSRWETRECDVPYELVVDLRHRKGWTVEWTKHTSL